MNSQNYIKNLKNENILPFYFNIKEINRQKIGTKTNLSYL